MGDHLKPGVDWEVLVLRSTNRTCFRHEDGTGRDGARRSPAPRGVGERPDGVLDVERERGDERDVTDT